MRQVRSRGLSLIEVVVSMLIMSIVSAAVITLALTQNTVAIRTFNKSSALLSGRQLQQYLEKDIHQAKYIGNMYATDGKPNLFPDSNGIPPIGTSPTAWSPPPYILDQSTLILQIPIFTVGTKIPTMLSSTKWNCDTYIYKIVPDTSKPNLGRFLLQRMIFPGDHSKSNFEPSVSSSTPKTIVKDIVGPIDSSDSPDPVAGTPTPRTFSFISKKKPVWDPVNTNLLYVPNSIEVDDLNGVSINLELFSNEASQKKELTPSTVAVRTEYYLRSNNLSQ